VLKTFYKGYNTFIWFVHYGMNNLLIFFVL